MHVATAYGCINMTNAMAVKSTKAKLLMALLLALPLPAFFFSSVKSEAAWRPGKYIGKRQAKQAQILRLLIEHPQWQVPFQQMPTDEASAWENLQKYALQIQTLRWQFQDHNLMRGGRRSSEEISADLESVFFLAKLQILKVKASPQQWRALWGKIAATTFLSASMLGFAVDLHSLAALGAVSGVCMGSILTGTGILCGMEPLDWKLRAKILNQWWELVYAGDHSQPEGFEDFFLGLGKESPKTTKALCQKLLEGPHSNQNQLTGVRVQSPDEVAEETAAEPFEEQAPLKIRRER